MHSISRKWLRRPSYSQNRRRVCPNELGIRFASTFVLSCSQRWQWPLFRPGPKANTRGARIWHMKKVKEQPGKEVCRNLLFLHATTGCDTTSRIYRVGKATVLKKFENVLSFKEQCLQLSFCCFRRCHCRWKSTCLIFWWWKTCKQDASYWVTKSKLYMAHVEFNRRIAFFWRLRTFLVVSPFVSRNVSAKSDLTAGYVDSKTP